MSTLSRQVLKWLQGLGITPHSTRREFANGYLVALIFSKYYPDAILMPCFDNGVALERKLSNWELLRKVGASPLQRCFSPLSHFSMYAVLQSARH